MAKNDKGEPALEEIDCPKGRTVSSAGLEHEPPVASVPWSEVNGDPGGEGANDGDCSPTKEPTASARTAAEAAAAAASVRRLYRVREAGGVVGTKTPDIVSSGVDLLKAGESFYGKAEVCGFESQLYFLFSFFFSVFCVNLFFWVFGPKCSRVGSFPLDHQRLKITAQDVDVCLVLFLLWGVGGAGAWEAKLFGRVRTYYCTILFFFCRAPGSVNL